MAVVVLVAPLAAWLPNAAMAGILFLVAWGLIDFHEIGHVLKTSRRETGIMAVTFFGALFLDGQMSAMALLTLILAVVWILLQNQISSGMVVFGIILGIIIPWMTSAWWPDRTTTSSSRRPRPRGWRTVSADGPMEPMEA